MILVSRFRARRELCSWPGRTPSPPLPFRWQMFTKTQAVDNTGDGNGTLTFGGGTIDANFVEIGIQLFGGRSAGRGVVNVNNEPGIGPAVLRVSGNISTAIQLPNNAEVTGSTALINIDG